MTNVNPGNRDPHKGRFGGARKFFSRDKGEDLLQDRDDLADDLVQEPASDHYESAGDGSFGEALDEYYDARDERDPRTDRADRADRADRTDRVASTRETAADENVEREPVVRGKHHRRDEIDSDGYGYSHGYETDSDGYGYAHGHESAAAGGAAAAGADYVEPELVPGDYIDGENNYGYTSKAAAYDDRADYDDYDQVDDRTDYVDEDDDRAVAAAGAGAAAAGAAGTGAAAREGEPRNRAAGKGAAGASSSTAAAAGGVPKRGLAMILIAVALLLALWGVYAMTKGGSDDQTANDPASQSAQNQNGQDAQGQNGQNGQNGANQNGDGQNPNAQNGQNPNDPNAQNQNGQENNQANGQNRQPGAGAGAGQADNNAPAGPNNPMTRENQTVNVYNNSAMPGFADQVAGQARGKGINVGEVGNIPGESAIFEQNTVLFDPATPGAEDRARELADTVGGIAIANDDRVPAEAKKPGSLTLVLAENREVAL